MTDHYKTDLEFMKIIEHFTMEEVAKEPGQGLPEALEGAWDFRFRRTVSWRPRVVVDLSLLPMQREI